MIEAILILTSFIFGYLLNRIITETIILYRTMVDLTKKIDDFEEDEKIDKILLDKMVLDMFDDVDDMEPGLDKQTDLEIMFEQHIEKEPDLFELDEEEVKELIKGFISIEDYDSLIIMRDNKDKKVFRDDDYNIYFE